jgi:hypothetical protein
MARVSLLPREEHFFHDFVGLSEEIRTGARTLRQMLADEGLAGRCREISRRFAPGQALGGLCARLEALAADTLRPSADELGQ